MSEMIYCGGKTCHGHGDYAVCGKVYWHDIYQCDSCRAKQKEKIVEELEQKLAESQREFRAADATIENLQMQLNAEREAKLALAAENAGLKAALRPSDIPSEWTDAFGDTAVIEHDATGDNQGHSISWSWVGNQEEVIKSVLLAVDKSIETPATAAFLAEVRAQGVEMAVDVVKQCYDNICAGGLQENREYEESIVQPHLDGIDDELKEIIAQLRQEAAQ